MPTADLPLGGWLSRKALFLAALLAELLILAYLLVWFGFFPDQVTMRLEAPPTAQVKLPSLRADEVLDTVSLFSGSHELGLETPTVFRRNLVYDRGQFMWFLLERHLDPTAPLYRRARSRLAPGEFERLGAGLTDGVLSFFYDVGGRRDVFVNNWTAVGVKELQASPLLPWSKRLDFVALSSISEWNTAGLDYIAGVNPGVLLVSPLQGGALQRLGLFPRAPNLLEFGPGLHLLFPGCWALVLPVEGQGRPPFELDLLLEVGGGKLALFAGSAFNRPLKALRRARRVTGREVVYYVGGTGYQVGLDTASLEAELARIRKEFPELTMVCNFNTSLVAHGVLEGILGDRYRPGRLGTRLKL